MERGSLFDIAVSVAVEDKDGRGHDGHRNVTNTRGVSFRARSSSGLMLFFPTLTLVHRNDRSVKLQIL